MRLANLDRMEEVAQNAYDAWNLAMAAADGKREINLVFKRQELSKAVKAVAEGCEVVDFAPVVHAHWIDTGNSFEDGQCRYNYWECSHCHRQITGRYGLPDYCPNCGARMGEVE